jgi:hypothetical protein
MNPLAWSNLAGGGLVAGMLVPMITLFFVHGRRFWRIIAVGPGLRAASTPFFGRLLVSTFSDRARDATMSRR